MYAGGSRKQGHVSALTSREGVRTGCVDRASGCEGKARGHADRTARHERGTGRGVTRTGGRVRTRESGARASAGGRCDWSVGAVGQGTSASWSRGETACPG